MASIVPSERFRRELEDAPAGVGQEQDPIEAIGRLGARLILQQALEEELTEFLGRERYERPRRRSRTATAISRRGCAKTRGPGRAGASAAA